MLMHRCQQDRSGRLCYANLRAFFTSIVRLGLLDRGRLSYWKFLLTTALRYPTSLGVAMTLAVKGYHFQVMTERLMELES
jgi:hypothetical protein